MVGVSYQEMLQSYGCVCPSGTTSQRRVDGVVLGTRGLWPLEGQDLYSGFAFTRCQPWARDRPF